MKDPFADAPEADEAVEEQIEETEAPEEPTPAKKAPAKKAAPKKKEAITVDVKPNLVAGDDGKHVVTLKGGSGFDAPWYVIHASGLDELEQLFSEDAGRLAALMERIQKAGAHFSGLGGSKPSGGSPQRGQAPQPAQEAPGGEERFCQHGKMTFRSGVSKKTGKPYEMFACSERDRDAQCKPQFLN